MSAFLTGSRAYGTPQPDSDIDLCVLVSREDLEVLKRVAGATDTQEYWNTDAALRFGSLNLLAFADAPQYEAWKRGTAELKEKRPVTRSAAIAHLDAAFLETYGARTSESSRLYNEVWKGREMGVSVSLYSLVRLGAATQAMWPDEFREFNKKLEQNVSDRTTWGVAADWLDENGAPELADAFRWISTHTTVGPHFGTRKGEYGFHNLPSVVLAAWSSYNHSLTTPAGLAVCLAEALAKARAELETMKKELS